MTSTDIINPLQDTPERRRTGQRRAVPTEPDPLADPIAFAIAFQPIADLVDRRIEGFEALVRGPAGQPARSVLDQAGPDRDTAFDLACQLRAIERAAALGMDRRLFLNLRPTPAHDADAAILAVLAACRRTGFPPDRLTFEILEGEADPALLRRIVGTLRRYGLRVALDDLGSGHSGLARLADLRPDTVKIDRSLTACCDRNRFRLELIASLVRLAAASGIEVIAEGVERREEMAALRQTGIHLVQGFHIAEPALDALATDALIPWPDLPPG